MSVLTVASLEGEPRAVFSALEHHWKDHAPAQGLLERTVARGPGGFVVVETWATEPAARAAWAIVRLEGIPTPDVEVYAVVARTGAPERAAGTWSEMARPDDPAWDEGVAPRDS